MFCPEAKFPSNDINFVFKEVPYPYKGTLDEAKTLIRDLLNQHQNESISAPFFNEVDELDQIKEELPDGWQIELDEDSRLPKSILRIAIYNYYEEVDRSSAGDFDSVKLKATNLFGYTWVVSDFEVADEANEDIPLELHSAKGDSPVRILLHGGHDEEIWDDCIDFEVTFNNDGVSLSEESLNNAAHAICGKRRDDGYLIY